MDDRDSLEEEIHFHLDRSMSMTSTWKDSSVTKIPTVFQKMPKVPMLTGQRKESEEEEEDRRTNELEANDEDVNREKDSIEMEDEGEHCPPFESLCSTSILSLMSPST